MNPNAFFQQQNQLDKTGSQRNSLAQNEDEGIGGNQQKKNCYTSNLEAERQSQVNNKDKGTGHSSLQ
jgi:hypothetical protein